MTTRLFLLPGAVGVATLLSACQPAPAPTTAQTDPFIDQVEDETDQFDDDAPLGNNTSDDPLEPAA